MVLPWGNGTPANNFAGYPWSFRNLGLSNPPTRALFLASPCPNSRRTFQTPSFSRVLLFQVAS